MSLQRIIERHWQQPDLLLTILLYGFSRLFQAAVSLRRRLYLSGCLKSEKLPLPVVVVGNLHSGGTGKTPVTAALVRELRRQGVAAGIVSRGYGRRSGDVHVLNDNSSAAEAGDEPLMLYRQTGAPVAVGTDRATAARALIAAHPELTLLVCDDGLQHYHLARDLEIIVYPAADAGRRPDLLPNGSLREPLSRLVAADAVLFSNGGADTARSAEKLFRLPAARFYSRTEAGRPYRFGRPAETLSPADIPAGKRCAAAAAIARPERFFKELERQGFRLDSATALPDHAAIDPAKLPAADYVFITEKDAVKLPPAAAGNIWVLPVCAIIAPDLAAFVRARLKL